jgi:single-stranded DNA-binding protein
MRKNNVELTGNLCADPKVHVTGEGKKMTFVKIAHNDTYKNSANNEVTTTVFTDITLSDQQGEWAAENLKKGMAVYTEGKLTSRTVKIGETNVTQVSIFGFHIERVYFPPKKEEATTSTASTATAEVVSAAEMEGAFSTSNTEQLPQ